jgi:hypothetical protein
MEIVDRGLLFFVKDDLPLLALTGRGRWIGRGGIAGTLMSGGKFSPCCRRPCAVGTSVLCKDCDLRKTVSILSALLPLPLRPEDGTCVVLFVRDDDRDEGQE